MMGKKEMIMTRLAMAAAACGVDINRVMQVDRNSENSEYIKGDPKGSKEVQDKKILDAEIKRKRKAMIKDGCSKEEIQIAIDAIKNKNNE